MKWPPWASPTVPNDREPADEVAARLSRVAGELERATLELRATVQELREGDRQIREEHVR